MLNYPDTEKREYKRQPWELINYETMTEKKLRYEIEKKQQCTTKHSTQSIAKRSGKDLKKGK